MKFSFTTIILLAFFAYVLNSIYVIYQLFNVPSCKGNSRKCLPPHRLIDENLEVSRARAIVYMIRKVNYLCRFITILTARIQKSLAKMLKK